MTHVHEKAHEARVRSPRGSGRRAAWASMVGAVADWYDYFLYGTAAGLVLGKLYFPGSVAEGAIAAFATFAIGFFFRPVGSVVFGHFGDRLGRKRMLVLTMILMGGASTAIGLLPTYSQIGIAAPILLVALRAVQGFAVGGEYGGAALMAVESAPPGTKAFRGSVVQTGAFVGLLLATATFLGVRTALSEASFESWGWRVPFLLSALILVVGYLVRRKVADSPEFQRVKKEGKVQKIPLLSALRKHPKSFVIIIGLYLGANVATYTVLTFALAFAAVYTDVSGTTILVASTAAAAVAALTVPIAAKISDKIGYFKVFVFGAVVAIVMAFPFFWSLQSGNTAAIIAATIVVLAVACASMTAVQQPIFTQLFDPEFRYSGAGFAYGLGAAVAGLSPFIATALARAGDGSSTGPALYMAGICGVTLLTAVAVRRRIESLHRADGVPAEGVAAGH